MPHTTLRDTPRTIRGLGALLLSLILVVAVAMVPLAAPEASAQPAGAGSAATSDGVNFGDCDFREGTGDVEQWANQICWIDMRGLDNSGSIKKQIGQYTLTADVTVEKYKYDNKANQTASFTAQSNQAWKDAAFGKPGFFEKDPASNQQDILRMDNGWARIKLNNIKIVDSAGNAVTNSRLLLADAEATGSESPGEWISASASGGATKLDAIKSPFSNNGTCRDRFGKETEPSSKHWTSHTALERDFVCWDKRGEGNRGTFVVAMDNPTWAEFGIATNTGSQAIALGVSLGHAQFASSTGRVGVKSAFEQAATGKASTADYTAVLRQGTTETPIAIPDGGGYATFMRTIGAGGVPQDQVVYRSTMKTDGASPFDRYEPEWTCVAKSSGGQAPVTTKLRSGSSNGFTVTNNRDTGTSEIATANAKNAELNCTVSWESKFQPATLELSKQLEGTAKDFSEMNERQFTINYKCADYKGYEAAYPGRLSGKRVFTRGQTATVTGLPVGANCNVWETFEDKYPPVLPGKTLTLGWGADGSTNRQQYNAAGANGQTSPALNLTLGATNNAAAHNVYDFKPGTLRLSQEIIGEPITDEFGGGTSKLPNPTYRFRIKCGTTQFDVEKQLELSPHKDANGKSVVDGSIDITGIPTERDCSVTPLTDLTSQQQQYINFDGRVVTVGNAATNPVKLNEKGEYPFRLSENAPETTMHYKTSYSYVKRDLTVHKLLSGEGGASPELDGKTFNVKYRCERKGEYDAANNVYIPNIAPVEGTVAVGRGKDDVIKDLKVGSQCKVWEDESTLPQTTYIKFDSATVASNNAQDQTSQLSNADAATKPVLTIRPTGDTEQNLVTVTNSYSARLGTVNVQKLVVNSAPNFTPPAPYEVTVRCGKRNLAENGAPRPYDLVGKATVSANGTSPVVADDPKLNVNGAMAVPYGNECTFEETPPSHPAGVAWANSGTERETVVAETTTKTITNTFTPRGSGLTVSQVLQGDDQLYPAEGVSYRLTCTGGGLDAPMTQDFTLTAADYHKTFDANFAPQGSDCVLERTSTETNQRTVNGTTFPITNNEGYRYAVDNKPQRDLGAAEHFTVGNTSAVTVTQAYNLVSAPVVAHKHVKFNPAYNGGPTYISDPRKGVKLHRQFPVTLKCTDPLGNESVRVETTVSANQDPVNGVNEYVGGADINANVPVGSTCAVEERYTTTATGISLVRDIDVNGAAVPGGHGDADNTGTVGGPFTVAENKNDLVFNNSYTRRTTDMTVKKIADLPGSIRDKVSPEELQSKLHDHTITMVCRDPEAKDAQGNEVPLYTAPNGMIHGEGSYTFKNVPVGSDCQFTGDTFGSLKLESNGAEAYLRPQYATWTSLGNGGNTTKDAALEEEVTSSPLFTSVDDPERNVVGLENHYRYEMAPIALTKDVVGDPADIEALKKGETTFNFSMTCRALGYESSSIGGQRNSIGYGYNADSGDPYVLPRKVAWGTGDGSFTRQADQDGKQVWHYTSDTAYVPAGSNCSFTEQSPSGVDANLNVTPRDANVQHQTAAPVAAPDQQASTDMAFTNDVARKTAPVRFVAYEAGYVEGESTPYTGEVKCTYGSGTKSTKTFTVNIGRGSVDVGSMPATDGAPTGGTELELPAGADCSIDYENAPALHARPVIDVTGSGNDKNRRPYIQFATWTGGKRNGPQTSLANTDPATITAKNYAQDFTVPGADGSDSRLVVGTEAYHPRARVDIEVNKTAEGGDAANKTFEFNQSCTNADQDFSLKNGGTHVIQGVYVNDNCLVAETDDGSKEVDSLLDVTGQGSRIADVAVSEGSAGAGEESTIVGQNVRFTALPVSEATDLRVKDSGLWRLDLRNRFPALKVTKSIDGTPLGDATGALTGVTLLPSDAKAMRVTYTATNNGAFTLKDMTLVDASLAGRTLTPVVNGQPSGTPVKVGADGAIPTSVCTPPDTLAVNGEYSCTFDVDISDKSYKENYRYPDGGGEAPVVVTAKMQEAGGQTVTAADSQGALRPAGVLGGLLPESGQQTLVWILALGALLFGLGAWRVTKRRNDDADNAVGEQPEGGELVEV